MRLVIDTNIVVSALFWKGAPAQLFEALIAADDTIFSSQLLVEELRLTLGKPKLAARVAAAGLTSDQLVERYRALCALVAPVALPHPIAPDPDDDWVISTALAAQADFIVTGDKPLLGVGSVGSIRIVGVTEALALVAAD
jgi:putative PIN family toxin of toxin-antitoxin system